MQMIASRRLVSILSYLVLIASQSIIGITAINEGGITLTDLPAIDLNLLVKESSSVNLYSFRSALIESLYSHLTSTLEELLPKFALIGVSLDCNLLRLANSDSSNNLASLEAVCSGATLVNSTLGFQAVDMHVFVYAALTGDHYRQLISRFAADDLLSTIQSVEVLVESALINLKSLSGESVTASYNETPKWRLPLLAAFSTVLAVFSLCIFVLLWRKYIDGFWGVKTGCEEKVNDNDNKDENDTEMGSEDGIDAKSESPTKSSPSRRLSMPVSNLSMIDEGEDEDSSIRSNLSAKISKMLGNKHLHLVGHDKEGNPVVEYISV